jgi:hypothetical protein
VSADKGGRPEPVVPRKIARPKNPRRLLDWQPLHDPRSREFPAVELVEAPTVDDVRWRNGRVLDQGAEGSCVGHGCVGCIGAEPVPAPRARVSHAEAVRWYERAQRLDEWPGDDYSGTSVNAGMKVGRAFGWWDGWRWAFGVDDMRQAIQLGPLVVGVPWRSGMYATGPDGLVTTEGSEVGGHCLLVIGWSRAFSTYGPGFWWLNSWGLDYGIRGAGFVPEETMAGLVEDVGEVAVPVGRKIGKSLDV